MKNELSLMIGRRVRSVRVTQGKSMTTLANESEMEYIQLGCRVRQKALDVV